MSITETITIKESLKFSSEIPFYKPIDREVEVFRHAFKNKLPIFAERANGHWQNTVCRFYGASVGATAHHRFLP